MTTRKIKRIKFIAIKNQLLETTRSQADIAADYEVGSSTVSLINNAGTWGNYLAGVRAPRPVRRAAVSSKAQSKVERAKAAGLKPLSAEDRKEKKFAAELKNLEETPTRNEFDIALDTVHERLSGQHRILTEKADAGDIPLLQVAVDLILVVLVIIALVK